ncbi:hypothetical protein P8452_26686 [Trifolium repens]|nr:hypothetical protein P8452_26686 [Trifolium repens]
MSTNGSRPKEDVFNENSEIWWLLHPSKLIYAVSDIDLHEVIADGLCYSFRVLRATAFDFSNKFGGCNSLQMGSRTMPRFVQVATLIG